MLIRRAFPATSRRRLPLEMGQLVATRRSSGHSRFCSFLANSLVTLDAQVCIGNCRKSWWKLSEFFIVYDAHGPTYQSGNQRTRFPQLAPSNLCSSAHTHILLLACLPAWNLILARFSFSLTSVKVSFWLYIVWLRWEKPSTADCLLIKTFSQHPTFAKELMKTGNSFPPSLFFFFITVNVRIWQKYTLSLHIVLYFYINMIKAALVSFGHVL